MIKKKILLVSENISRLKDLIYSGIINDLKKQYDTEFLIESEKKLEEKNYFENKINEFIKKNKIVYVKKSQNLIISSIKKYELIFF